MKKELIDNTTGIYNQEYLKRKYQSYLNNNPDSNFVMIDFEKFKNINDTFGHNIGDNYLKVFAKILVTSFNDSIIVRLHGDEFVILTKYSEEDISKIFKLCDRKIVLAVLEGKIPKIFKYNAGSTKAEHGIANTKEKADFMMYYAKRNNLSYQKFENSIYKEKIFQDSFLNKVDLSLKYGNFSYSFRQLFDNNNIGQNIFQIYTKDKNGMSIFDNNRYEILKKTSKLQQFDIYNIQNLFENISFDGKQMIFIIDYSSLIFTDALLEYFNVLKDISSLPFENIIISINLLEIEKSSYLKIIEKINQLKSLGFKVRLEKFDNTMGDVIWEESDSDYIKISNNYWKDAMDNYKKNLILESKVEAYDKCQIIPIFECVEKQEEYDFLKTFVPESTLFSGNYFSNEKKLILKK